MAMDPELVRQLNEALFTAAAKELARFMSEAEWHGCEKPCDMLRLLDDPFCMFSNRKRWLFACACCRRVGHLLPDADELRLVEAVERFADEPGDLRAFREAYDLFVKERGTPSVPRAHERTPHTLARRAVREAATLCVRATHGKVVTTAPLAADHAAEAAELHVPGSGDAERRAQCDLLRDLVGNPYRPVAIDPAWFAWGGGTVRRIARAAYDRRAFDELPILADALEDAGCGNADLLAHLRDTARPHVRGCWALDLLLGRA